MAMPHLLGRLVARAKPMVPPSVWPTLLTLRSLRGDGPIIGLPELDRALVLVAHPDDESIACAGTMALLADGGARVDVLALTDGEATIGSPHDPAETGRRRRDEMERAAALLGASARFAGLPDGHLPEHRAEITTAIATAVAYTTPQVIFAPWLGDGHADHRAVAFALADCTLDPDVEIWGYETWAALPMNRLVDITAAYDRKQAAVAVHETASGAFDLSSGLGLSRWRAMHGLLGEGYGEAFLATSAAEYVQLAHRLDAFDDTLGPEE